MARVPPAPARIPEMADILPDGGRMVEAPRAAAGASWHAITEAARTPRMTSPSAGPTVLAVRSDVPLVEDEARPSRLAAWLLLLPTAAMIALPFFLAAVPFALWLALTGCMLSFFILFGWAASGKWYGILVGSTKSISLGITQALLWSCLILPALITAFANRLPTNPTDALAVGFDPQLAWLMGIPAVGLAGSKIIGATKGNGTRAVAGLASKQVNYATAHLDTLWDDYAAHHASPLGAGNPTQLARPAFTPAYRNTFRGQLRQAIQAADTASTPGAASAAGAAGREVPLGGKDPPTALASPTAFATWAATYLRHSTKGVLVTNHRIGEASLRDLVEGDEIGDEARTDFGKAQYLVITAICLAAYATALAWMFLNLPAGCGAASASPCITELPPASQAIPAVLLVSTVAYLGLKAAPSTPTT